MNKKRRRTPCPHTWCMPFLRGLLVLQPHLPVESRLHMFFFSFFGGYFFFYCIVPFDLLSLILPFWLPMLFVGPPLSGHHSLEACPSFYLFNLSGGLGSNEILPRRPCPRINNQAGPPRLFTIQSPFLYMRTYAQTFFTSHPTAILISLVPYQTLP